MGRLACIWIGCGLLGGQLAAQLSSRTYFEERLLDRAPIIVRARFDADQSCFDVDVAAFKVTQRLRGDVDSRILVLGAAQLSKQFRDLERLLFLKREPSGCLYRIVDVIDLVAEADAVEAFVRGFLALVDDANPAKRRAGLKQLVLDGLAMRTEFPRKLAVREVERMARRVPPVFSIDEIAELSRLAKTLPPDEAERLLAALDAEENALLKELAGTQTAFARGPRRTLYLKASMDYLQDSDAVRRATAADHIALRFGESAVPFLMKLLDDDAMTRSAAMHLGPLQVRSAGPKLLEALARGGEGTGQIIVCLGEIGDDAAVPAVGRYLSSADHFDAAALALARIGGPSANRLLDGVLAQLKRDPRQQPRVELVERIRSKEFLEEDTERRVEGKGRYSRE